MPTFAHHDILSIKDFSKTDLLHILRRAAQLKKQPHPTLLQHHVMASCFFEPSTRTRLSFEGAMQHLGGRVIGFADPAVTSSKKGETLHDTMKIIGQYADVIVIRHALEGAARVAAEATDKPVINAGDGRNQHPTQAALDLFTIQECQTKIDGLHIALMGDLKYQRGIHSLVQALAHFAVRLYFVAPALIQLPEYLCRELKTRGISFSFHTSVEEVIKKIDILYLTRIMQERYEDEQEYARVKNAFYFHHGLLQGVKTNLRILHILPRVTELDPSIDDTPFAYYFEQAKNGLYVRQALLALMLEKA